MRQIFIHGLGQAPSAWDKTLSCLSQGVHASCPDVAALIQGQECSYQNLYHAFSSYCCQGELPVNLCGLSLGAVLALNFAAVNPEKVSSLILIAPQYKMPKMLLWLQSIVFRFMPNSAFKEMGFDKRAFINLTRSMADLDFSERLKDIACPTLILCGEKDRVNTAACQKAAGRIPNAKIGFIKNSGHEVNIDSPQGLSDAINSFLKSIHAVP